MRYRFCEHNHNGVSNRTLFWPHIGSTWHEKPMRVASVGSTENSAATVMVVDNDPARADLLCSRLRYLHYSPVVANDPDSDNIPGDAHNVAIVVGDAGTEELTAAVSTLAERFPQLPVLLANEDEEDPALCTLLQDRPAWHLDFPLRRAQLAQLLQRAERYDGIERRQRITGHSRAICSVRRSIEQVADFDTTVLVTGESGTGKELVARTIHDLSARRDMPFVPINCGAIPAELLESELFGHEKGAFTGAISSRTGRFELAEGGTLFLDEIGDMSLPMQVKLLRVLQERSYESVGSNKLRKCDVRIVAATHRNLQEMVRKGEFREDLYFRLNVFPIDMPPLCKRSSDLPELLDELLLQHCSDGEHLLRVSRKALRALAAYSWPGNIRELGNLVERLAILKPTGVIEMDDLPRKYLVNTDDGESPCPSAGNDEDKSALLEMSEHSKNLKAYLQGVEQDLIRQAMQQSDNVVAQAARLLKIRRTTLVEKLNKYSIH